jgi:hypothetical protein
LIPNGYISGTNCKIYNEQTEIEALVSTKRPSGVLAAGILCLCLRAGSFASIELESEISA